MSWGARGVWCGCGLAFGLALETRVVGEEGREFSSWWRVRNLDFLGLLGALGVGEGTEACSSSSSKWF